MTVAKLYYYSATGKAQQIRLALAAADIEFEDVFATCGFPPSEEQKLEWRKLGKNTTTNIPMLVMPDGKVYTQSAAVLRVVGRMGNLMPNCEEDLYKTDKLIEDSEDFRKLSYKAFIIWGATKEDYWQFVNEQIPQHFGNLERQLLETTGGEDGYFVIKDRLTIADVAIYDAVVNFGYNRAPSHCLDKFPHLSKWVKLFETHPKIASYLSSEQYAKVGFRMQQPEFLSNLQS